MKIDIRMNTVLSSRGRAASASCRDALRSSYFRFSFSSSPFWQKRFS